MLHSTLRTAALVVGLQLLLLAVPDSSAAPVAMRDWGEITARLYPFSSTLYFPDFYYVRPYLRPQYAASVHSAKPSSPQSTAESTIRLRRGTTPEPFVQEPVRRGYTAWELSRKRRSTIDGTAVTDGDMILSDHQSTKATSPSLFLADQGIRTRPGESPGIVQANAFKRRSYNVMDLARQWQRRRRRHLHIIET